MLHKRCLQLLSNDNVKKYEILLTKDETATIDIKRMQLKCLKQLIA